MQSSLTLRGVARSVAFVTMSRATDTQTPQEIPNADTLVYYMGRKDGVSIAMQLIASGRDLTTPVVVIEAISTEKERKLFTTLSSLEEGALDHWSDAELPAILLVGQAFARVSMQQSCLEDVFIEN